MGTKLKGGKIVRLLRRHNKIICRDRFLVFLMYSLKELNRVDTVTTTYLPDITLQTRFTPLLFLLTTTLDTVSPPCK